jgi:hypothetical protein
MKSIVQIDKEQVKNLTFTKKEVISTPEERKIRSQKLERSQTLGNLLHSKVRITFCTAEDQVYEVNTTVWAVGPEYIVLKGGVTIPTNSILSVE